MYPKLSQRTDATTRQSTRRSACRPKIPKRRRRRRRHRATASEDLDLRATGPRPASRRDQFSAGQALENLRGKRLRDQFGPARAAAIENQALKHCEEIRLSLVEVSEEKTR